MERIQMCTQTHIHGVVVEFNLRHASGGAVRVCANQVDIDIDWWVVKVTRPLLVEDYYHT